MDRDKLLERICETEKQMEKGQRKRNAIVIAIFTVIFFLIFYYDERPTGLNIIGAIIPSFIFAFLHFGINAAIFGWLYEKNESDRKYLEHLKKQLSEAENETH